jgi:hypothetical protein
MKVKNLFIPALSLCVLTVILYIGCDNFKGADEDDPLAGKTFVKKISNAAAGTGTGTPTSPIFITYFSGTLWVQDKTYTSADWGAYAILVDFFELDNADDTDTITFDGSGLISKLEKNGTTADIIIKIGTGGYASREIAQTAFASALTLTGLTLTPSGGFTTKDFALANAFTVNTLTVTNRTLTVKQNSTLTITGTATLDTTTGSLGSLALTAGTTGTTAAKLTGPGKVIAGKTEIFGGANGWEAVGTYATAADIITIAVTSTTASSITSTNAANDGKLTAGTGASITQTAGSGNALTIAADTTIDLKGTTTKVGSIVLKGDATAANGGKITFANATTSIIKTGNTAILAAEVITSGAAAANTATGLDLATSTVKAKGDAASSGTAGKLVEISGDASSIVTFTASTDVTLNSETAVTITN